MNTETLRIQDTLKRHWDGPMWHGANLKEILTGIDYETAFRKPAAGTHNIYELVQHMNCWRKFVLEHMNENLDYKVEINSETDWPTKYEVSEENWRSALTDLEKNQAGLMEALNNFNDEKLNESMHGRKFNWYVFIHGIIQHDIYHSAQISILKK